MKIRKRKEKKRKGKKRKEKKRIKKKENLIGRDITERIRQFTKNMRNTVDVDLMKERDKETKKRENEGNK